MAAILQVPIVQKTVNKTLMGAGLGALGYFIGTYIECYEGTPSNSVTDMGYGGNHPSILNCTFGKIADDVKEAAETATLAAWLNLTVLGQVTQYVQVNVAPEVEQTYNAITSYEYKSVIGHLPDISCSLNSSGQKLTNHQGLCYDDKDIVAQGYRFSSAGRYTKGCNEGERDDGISCWRDTKGRGAGYPWKVGDEAFSLKDARKRCSDKHGYGNCEKYGAIIYPKCNALYGDSYDNVGCCLCESKEGLSNIKPTKWIVGNVPTPQAPLSQRLNKYTYHDGLYYDDYDLIAQGWSYESPGIYTKPKMQTVPIGGDMGAAPNSGSSSASGNQSESQTPLGYAQILGSLGLVAGIYYG
jgi:hypothetical protein